MNEREKELLLDLLLEAAARAEEPADALDDAKASAAMRERFVAAVQAEAHAPFATRLAELFDVAVDRAREMLATLSDTAGWTEMLPGMRYRDFEGGPNAVAASVGLVVIEAGGTFPGHTHKGVEQTLILQGTMHTLGKSFGPGEELEMAKGSWHEVCAGDDRDLVYATVVDEIEIGPKPEG